MEIFLENLIYLIIGFLVIVFDLIKKKKKEGLIGNKNIKFKVIDNCEDLKSLVNLILKNEIKLIGLDSEYYRGDEYNGSLCMIQLAIPIGKEIEVFIIDFIKIPKENLKKELTNILADQKIEKVIHACDNDLEWIYDELNILVKNIFDTQDVFQFLYSSKQKSGLNHLINKYFSLNFDDQTKKKFQKSNWKQRPLSKEQLEYAALDAYYLIDLRNILKDELNLGNLSYELYIQKFQERIEKRFTENNKKYRNEIKATNFFISNITKCDPETFDHINEVFLEIFRTNDEMAKSLNVNPEKILSLKMIFKIAKKMPGSKADLLLFINSTFTNTKEQSILISNEILDKKQSDEFINDIHNIIVRKISQLPQGGLNLENEDEIFDNTNLNLTKNKSGKRMIEKEKILKKFSCKKPIYENCRMQAPDGELLSFCDTKKMNWYLQRELAELVTEDPPTFRLLFEPNGRGCSDLGDIPSSFYVKYRKNCCVVCGSQENYMRFHVVPILYRHFFPHELKSHKSHDVVLLCFPCHEKANQIYDIQKKVLSQKFDVPLQVLSDDQKEVKELQSAVSNAKTLYKNYEHIPLDKKEMFTQEVVDFLISSKDNEKFQHFYEKVFIMNKIPIPYEAKNLTKQILNYIRNYKVKTSNFGAKKNHHGKLIVDKLDDFTKFIREWRVFFIETLQPKYLPDSWNVEHEFYRTFGNFSRFNQEKENIESKI